MTTAVATLEPRSFNHDEVALIKDTVCRGSTDGELKLFIHQCQKTGLDPFSRQIHAVKRWDGKMKREVMTIQTGIDGYRLIAERTGHYAGNDDPVFDREDADHPGKATVTVWKLVQGQRVSFTRSARWNEFVQTTKEGEVTRFWKKMPYLMLGKVAEALALRAAFPQELSGLYTHEEMGQADIVDGEVVEPAAKQPAPQPPAKPVNGNGTAPRPQQQAAAPVDPPRSNEPPPATDYPQDLLGKPQVEWLRGQPNCTADLRAALGLDLWSNAQQNAWPLVTLVVRHGTPAAAVLEVLSGHPVNKLDAEAVETCCGLVRQYHATKKAG